MRIPNGYISNQLGVEASRSTNSRHSEEQASDTPAASGRASDADIKVSVSSEARRLAMEAEAIDVAKVERLRDAITAGTFEIDPDKIADAIVERS